MITSHHPGGTHHRHNAVAKLRRLAPKGPVHRLPTNRAQAKDASPLLGQDDAVRPHRTVANLLRSWPVVGRSAVARRYDQSSSQNQSIVVGNRRSLVSNSSFMQRSIQPITRSITRKHPSGAVRAIRGRSKANDQILARCIAKGRHRPPPIGFAHMPLRRVRRNLGAPSSKTRTSLARRNLLNDPQDFAGH